MKTGSSLTDIAKELERQVQSKRDFTAPTKDLSLEDRNGSGMGLKINGYGTFDVSEIAHNQIAERVKIPRPYYERMRSVAPQLLTRNVNHWFVNEPENRMVRTLDGRARAFLSQRYRPLDNVALAETVLPIISDKGCKVESAELTESRLYIKAVSPRIRFEIKKDDIVQAGIVISNSEVGMGSVKVEPLILRLVCLNGMIVQDYGMNKYHVGRAGGSGDMAEEFFRDETRQADDKAFWMKVQDVVSGSFNQDIFARVAQRLTEAASEKMEGDPVKACEVTQKRFGLSDGERASVLTHLIQGGDLSRYGLLNAITRSSQESKDYDRATDLERLGGQVLELPKQEWSTIAQAR